jgi:chromosome segregation protein
LAPALSPTTTKTTGTRSSDFIVAVVDSEPITNQELQQQVEQTRARSGRLEQDLAEVASQQEELTATKLEAETRFEELDTEIAALQEVYSEAELAGEALQLKRFKFGRF